MSLAASTVRLQIESALAHRIPSALTRTPKLSNQVASTGVPALDKLLQGGLPVGAVSELVGPECSGRTSAALSFIAGLTQAGKVCAWIDVSDALDPASAVAAGVELARLLWIRCGVSQGNLRHTSTSFTLPEECWVPGPVKKGLHGGGFGPHPRNETKDLSHAIRNLFEHDPMGPRCAEPQRHTRPQRQSFEPSLSSTRIAGTSTSPKKPCTAMDQALRSTDLLLQGGGFSAVVFDMGSIAPESASRVPLSTWFRYRAAAERTQSSIVLLTQYPCAKSSAELLLRFQPGEALDDGPTVFTGIDHRVELARRRFAQTSSNVVPMRKPPQSENATQWQSRAIWAGRQ